jgi:serine/threonine-protein kinase
MIGSTLGNFHLTEKLGEGGMGVVYRATDMKLGRDVALKVLPESLAGDRERLARFEREATVLASLNHENIASLYQLEEVDSVHFLIMELAEGETLKERIAQGPMSIEEAVPVATQIARGLEWAHAHGVIHRDLKPANVKITPEGKVKILDFGLAKAMEQEAGVEDASPERSSSPTLTAQMGSTGSILGTAAYTSPEQIRGHEADRRSDIWAFGVVLWEMLSGRSLFGADTVSDTLAAVLQADTEFDPPSGCESERIETVLKYCLARDPNRRLRDIADVRLMLESVPPEEGSTNEVEVRPPPWRQRELLAWGLAVTAIGAATVFWWKSPERLRSSQPTRFNITLAQDAQLAFPDVPMLALSPDGRTLAFAARDPESGQEMIHLRELNDIKPRPLAGTEGGVAPFFSPDGRQLGFFADTSLKTVPRKGGAVQVLAHAPNPRGASWTPQGDILFSPLFDGGLWRISPSGGTPAVVIEPSRDQNERTFRWPEVLPGGRAILYTVGFTDSPNYYDNARIEAYSLDSGKRRVLVEEANMARFAAPDTLLYSRAGSLYAVPFDPGRLEVRGKPARVLDGVGGDPSSGAGYFDIASNGTLALVPGAVSEGRALLALVDREGGVTYPPLETRAFYHPRFSPEGGRLAFTEGLGQFGLQGDVWIYFLASEALSRFTFGGNELYALWTPDGREITYLRYADEAEILTRLADGSGPEVRLAADEDAALFPESWSPDGRTLAYTRNGATTDIYLTARTGEPRLFAEDASAPTFSPDGRWIAYSSPGVGNTSVFVRPVEGEGLWQVSPELGGYPRWSADGRELLYIDIGAPERPLMAVQIETGESFRAGKPRILVDGAGRRFTTTTAPAVNWDAARDGSRFAFVELQREEGARSRVEVRLDWIHTLELERQ